MGSGINNTVLPVVKYKVDLIYSRLLLDDTILGGYGLFEFQFKRGTGMGEFKELEGQPEEKGKKVFSSRY